MIVGEKPLTLTVINIHVLCYKEPTVTIKNKDDIYFPYFIRQTNAFIFSHIHRNTSRIKELAPSFFFLKFSKVYVKYLQDLHYITIILCVTTNIHV